MSGRPSGRNATLINRSGGAQPSKAEQLLKAAHASGQQLLSFCGRPKSARIAEAASAPEADSRSPVEIAEAEADAADAASNKAHVALFLAQNSVIQLKKDCRTAVHHHRHLIKKFASKNMSVEYSCIFLAFFCDRYNCDACDVKLGHYNPELYVDLRNYYGSIYGDVIYAGIPSGHEYALQDDLQFMVPMTAETEDVNPAELKSYQPTVRYLAEKMRVRHPEISQFNLFERNRFKSMVPKHFALAAVRPNFTTMRLEWNASGLLEDNTRVSGQKPKLIHAKAERHLEDYYDNHYLRSLEFKKTMNPVQADLDLALKEQRKLNPAGCDSAVPARTDPSQMRYEQLQVSSVAASAAKAKKLRDAVAEDKGRRVYRKKLCFKCGMSTCGKAMSSQNTCDSFTTYQRANAGHGYSSSSMRDAYNGQEERRAFLSSI